MSRKRVGILISGRGSNMVSLIQASRSHDAAYDVACVISNRPDAPGLQLASDAGVPVVALDHKKLATRDTFDAALHEALVEHRTQLVACAGFMRILTPGFVTNWAGRIINIHPSLLPLFKGIDTHRQALDAGVRVHGCSVHFVSEALDAGAIIAQGVVKVLPGDDEDALAARVLQLEHKLYPRTLNALAENRVRLQGEHVEFSDRAAAELSMCVDQAGEQPQPD